MHAHTPDPDETTALPDTALQRASAWLPPAATTRRHYAALFR